MKQIISIQYLRALAALMVVLFHHAEATGHWFSVGAAGVDIFFVISGFIMYMVTEDKEKEPGVFVRRRLTRIVPLYWCVTVLTAAIYFVRPHLLWGVDGAPSHVLASLFFMPRTNAMGQDWPTVLQGWTLNIEMFFYAVIAASLFLPRRLQLPLISALLTGLVAAGMLLDPQGIVAKTYTNNLLLEFTAGLWLGRLFFLGRVPGGRVGYGMLAAGFTILGVEQILHVSMDSLRLLSGGIPALLIVFGALSIEASGKVRVWPVLKLIGDASYSIYLLHDIVVAVVNRLHLPLPLAAAGAVAGATMVGVLSFLWFERPLYAWLRSLQKNA